MANRDLTFTLLGRDKSVGKALASVGDQADGLGNRMSGVGKGIGIAMAGAAVGLGALAKSAVDLEAQFSQTMNTMAAVAEVPAEGIKELSKLAMKMGADTVFSANDAAEAMLELAKGGLTAATIKAGALKGTLTLAAAGGTSLTTAATIASNALNTFALKGKDMASVAAALAGGAAASTASVESLGEALGQVGPGARTAGLSLQETVAVLSAFDQAGIKGSDAGTSLKTMLTRLVPATAKAKGMMQDLGLKFTDATGTFLPIADVAQQLKDKLGGLSDEQRTLALSTLFGSDATRAATVLMNIGAEGVNNYTKATSDLSAAQRVADARMKGTAGAIEAMKGSLETAMLAMGQVLAPLVVIIADGLATAFNALGSAVQGAGGFVDQHAATIAALIATATAAWVFFKTNLVPVIVSLGEFIAQKVIPPVTTLAGVIMGALMGAVRTVSSAIAAHREELGQLFRAVGTVIEVFMRLAGPVLGVAFKNAFAMLAASVAAGITVLAALVRAVGAVSHAAIVTKDAVVGAFNTVVTFITGLPGRISSIASGMFDGIKNAFRSAINWIIRAWNALEFKIPGFDPPGPGPKFDGFTLGMPNIDELAKGGIVPATPGGRIVKVAEAGQDEAVIPLNRGMNLGGGPNINVYVQGSVIAENDLADKIQQVLLRKQARSPLGFVS